MEWRGGSCKHQHLSGRTGCPGYAKQQMHSDLYCPHPDRMWVLAPNTPSTEGFYCPGLLGLDLNGQFHRLGLPSYKQTTEVLSLSLTGALPPGRPPGVASLAQGSDSFWLWWTLWSSANMSLAPCFWFGSNQKWELSVPQKWCNGWWNGGVLDEQTLLLRSGTKQMNTLLLLKDTGTSGLATKSCPAQEGWEAPGPPCTFSRVYTTHPVGSYFVMVLRQRFNECQATQL